MLKSTYSQLEEDDQKRRKSDRFHKSCAKLFDAENQTRTDFATGSNDKK